MNTIDLSTLTFEPAPGTFDQSGTIDICEIADLEDGRQIILAYENEGEPQATLALDTGDRNWAHSTDEKDGETLTQHLGDWRTFLTQWEEETREEYESEQEEDN